MITEMETNQKQQEVTNNNIFYIVLGILGALRPIFQYLHKLLKHMTFTISIQNYEYKRY